MADSRRKDFGGSQDKSIRMKKSLESSLRKVSQNRGTATTKANSAMKSNESNAKSKCCQCQANRRCLRCRCVQNGRSCVDCYPSRNSPSTCANLPSGQSSTKSPREGYLLQEVEKLLPMKAPPRETPSPCHFMR